MEFNIILAGVGGQGILTIAQAISRAAIRRGCVCPIMPSTPRPIDRQILGS